MVCRAEQHKEQMNLGLGHLGFNVLNIQIKSNKSNSLFKKKLHTEKQGKLEDKYYIFIFLNKCVKTVLLHYKASDINKVSAAL